MANVGGPIEINAGKAIKYFIITTQSGDSLEFRPNGDIYWKNRLITSDIDLVTGLRELLFNLRQDAEYRRRLTIIKDIHEK